jgi:predicted lipoprotein with Yx(FWY)xxD motif
MPHRCDDVVGRCADRLEEVAMRREIRWVAAIAVAAGLLVAGCGDESDSESASTTRATTGAGGAATTASAPATTALSAADVNVAESPLGEILVDAEGLTLYVFMNDTAGTTTCTDACAEAWPPLIATDVSVGDDLAEADFTLVARPDGTQQLAVGGMPLYRFAGDSAPGDTAGQGLNGVWYVVSPDGSPNRDA